MLSRSLDGAGAKSALQQMGPTPNFPPSAPKPHTHKPTSAPTDMADLLKALRYPSAYAWTSLR